MLLPMDTFPSFGNALLVCFLLSNFCTFSSSCPKWLVNVYVHCCYVCTRKIIVFMNSPYLREQPHDLCESSQSCKLGAAGTIRYVGSLYGHYQLCTSCGGGRWQKCVSCVFPECASIHQTFSGQRGNSHTSFHFYFFCPATVYIFFCLP